MLFVVPHALQVLWVARFVVGEDRKKRCQPKTVQFFMIAYCSLVVWGHDNANLILLFGLSSRTEMYFACMADLAAAGLN